MTSLAAALYTLRAPIAPAWDQLGGITQGVWLEQAELLERGLDSLDDHNGVDNQESQCLYLLDQLQGLQ